MVRLALGLLGSQPWNSGAYFVWIFRALVTSADHAWLMLTVWLLPFTFTTNLKCLGSIDFPFSSSEFTVVSVMA